WDFRDLPQSLRKVRNPCRNAKRLSHSTAFWSRHSLRVQLVYVSTDTVSEVAPCGHQFATLLQFNVALVRCTHLVLVGVIQGQFDSHAGEVGPCVSPVAKR